MKSRTVKASRVFMTELILPTHINAIGTVFGGVIMSWIDIAAAISAQRHSSSSVVTASIDTLNFTKSAYTGWVVSLKASVNLVGRTSMEVGVRVDGENLITGEGHRMASAFLTFVALDKDGKPTQVPELVLESAEDLRRNEAALLRRKYRLGQRLN